ncbi:unnamed protein product, partial [Gulo gulo]
GACALKRAAQQLSRRFSPKCNTIGTRRVERKWPCPCGIGKEVPETLNPGQGTTCPLRRRCHAMKSRDPMKRPCVAASAKVPADSQCPLPAMRVSHFGRPAHLVFIRL